MLKRTTLIAGLVLSAIGFSNAPVKALNHTGNLFVGDYNSSSIIEITPNGTKSTFASGLNSPYGLAFDSSGNLFVSDGSSSSSITEITPNGTKSTFASGLDSPRGLAFDGQTNSSAVPEPSNLLAVFGGLVSLGSLRKLKNKKRNKAS